MPASSPRVSTTEAAVYQQTMYGQVEGLWNGLPAPIKERWLRSCRVPKLSGRDLFGRVNWWQVDWHDRYEREIPASQPHAPKHYLDPLSVAIPAAVAECLGGAWTQQGGPLTLKARRYRTATALRPTLMQSWQDAWVACKAAPWGTTAAGDVGNWAYWSKFGAQYYTRWQMIESDWWWGGLARFRNRDLKFGTTGNLANSVEYLEPAFSNLEIRAEFGVKRWGKVLLPKTWSIADTLTFTDYSDWGTFPPAGAFPVSSGYRATGLESDWWQRG